MKRIEKKLATFLTLILGFSQIGFSQNIGDLCTKDYYKRGNGLNPLIMSMKRTLSSVPEKNLTTTAKHFWTKGYVSNQVYRNGYEIYDLYAELIQMADSSNIRHACCWQERIEHHSTYKNNNWIRCK